MSQLDNFKCKFCNSNNFIISRGGKSICCTSCHTIYDESYQVIYKGHAIKQQEKLLQQQKEEEERIPKLITCPACNNQVSNQATSCPHCGQPINTKPRCPMCNSYDIKQVTGMERAMSVGFWGFASKKINKSFECKKCGHTW